ncbi:MAG: hypothetical protein K6E59_05820 [Bacilli bacterium]|nr:hypothetical protein [Bacilli bacterium]
MINTEQIMQWVETGFLIAFIVFLAGFVIAFLRGLLRGWKQGTYRLIFLGTLATVLLCLLPVWVNIVGGINLAQWIPSPVVIEMEGKSFNLEISTVFETVYNFMYGLLHDIFQVKATPEAIANYAIALTGSLIRLVLVFLIAFVTETIGALLCWILWHAAFKHIIKKENRKPKLRVVSGLEEAVVWFGLIALTVIPFSGLANAIHNNGSVPEDSGNETIDLVSRILKTYDESIFNKAVFSWTKMGGKDTLDTRIAEFFAQNSYSTEVFSADANIITEFRVISSLEGGFVKWFFADQPEEALASSFVSYSLFMGETLYDIAFAQNEEMVNGIVPLTFDIAGSIDEIQHELLSSAPTDAPSMKSAYRRVASTDYVSAIEDVTKGEYALATYDSILPYSESYLDVVRKSIDSDDSARALVNSLVTGYVLGQAEENPDWASGPMAEFLPTIDGALDEEAIASIDWWKEANIFQSASQKLGPLGATSAEEQSMGELGEKFLEAIARDPYGLIEIFVGPRDETGEPTVNDKGQSAKDLCLLDSDLITIMLPAIAQIGVDFLEDQVLKGEAPEIIDKASTVIEGLMGQSTRDVRVNFKRELGSVLDIAGKVAVTDIGKGFIRDFQSHPGLDFAADGTLINLDPALAEALMGGVRCIDRSKILSVVGPTVADYFMQPLLEDGPMKDIGLYGVNLQCPNLGAELANLLSIGIYCNDMITSIGGLFKQEEGSGFSANVFLDAINALESDEGHYQVTHLLDILASSPILNPDVTVDGKSYHNANLTALLNYLFSTFNLDEPIKLELADLTDVRMDSVWKNGNQLDEEHLGESYYILRAFKEIVDPGSGVFALITELGDSSPAKAVSTLSRIDVATLFSKIGDSAIMRLVCPSLFDKLLLGTLMNSDNAMNLIALDVTYSNLLSAEDWAKEGETMQDILTLATRGLDISNLDFFSPSVIDLMRSISQSMMFFSPGYDEQGAVALDEGGEVVRDYTFPVFVRDKLLLSLTTKDSLSLFTDYPDLVVEIGGTSDTVANHLATITNWDKKESLDAKLALCSTFAESLTLMKTPAEWDTEFTKLGRALAAVQSIGGLDGFATFNPETIPSLSMAITAICQTQAFGPVLIGNIFNRAFSSASLPEEIRGSGDVKPNFGWYFRNANDFLAAKKAGATQTELDAIVAQRLDEVSGLMNLVSATLGNDKIKDGDGNFNLSFGTLDVDGFLRPVLTAAVDSKVFNPNSPSDMYSDSTPVPETTLFHNLLLTFMKRSGVFVDGSGAPIADYMTPLMGTTKSLSAIVKGVGDWYAEIENICEVVGMLQASSFLNDEGQFDLSGLEDLGAFFAKPGASEELCFLINGIQESELFFRCLPPKLDQALNNGLSALSVANIADDLKCADFFYSKKDGDLAPYTEEEVATLIHVFADISQCMNLDLTDLTKLDVEPLVSALREMGASNVFNSNKEKSATVFGSKGDPLSKRSGLTAYQSLLCDIVLVDSLEDYYYFNLSPKDLAATANYTNAKGKIAYYVPRLLPALSDEGMTRTKFLEAADRYIVNELGGIFDVLKQKQFVDFINGTAAFEDLTEASFTTLLHSLNDCTFYRDCVPNAFYDALIVKNTIGIAGVDFTTADVFFSYYYYEGNVFSSTRKATPNFEMPFYGPEIDHIGMLYSLLKENKDSMSDLHMDSVDPIIFRNVLLELHDSYVFHEAAKDARHDPAYSPMAKQFHDLTVFEQFIYKVFVDTTLFQSNFNARKDYAYVLAYGDEGAYYKMHDRIVGYTSAGTGWIHQIEALTTDGRSHAGTDDDPWVGVVEAGKRSGIFNSSSEVGVDYEVLNKVSPKQVKTLLYAINQCTLLSDLLPNAVGDLLGVNDEGKGIGLDQYSNLERTYTTYVGKSVFDVTALAEFFLDGDTSKAFQDISTVTFPVASNPSGHYTVTLKDDSDVTSCIPMTYEGGKATFVTEGLPQAFKITLGTGYVIGGDVVTLTNLASFDIGADGFATKSIKAIGYLLSSVYRGERPGSCYFSFTNTDGSLANFFSDDSDYTHSTYGLLGLFGLSGFYDRELNSSNVFVTAGDGDYSAASYTFYNALNFKVAVPVNISLDLSAIYPGVKITLPNETTISISDHVGSGSTAESHMETIHGIFSSLNGIEDYVREARWFDLHAADVGTFDVYNGYQGTALNATSVGGVDITNPAYRYLLAMWIDNAFTLASEDAAIKSIQGALAAKEITYSITVADDATHTTTYEGTNVSPKFATEILANLVTHCEQNKADMVDLAYATATATSPMVTSYKYTRIGDKTNKVSTQAGLHDDLYASDCAKLTPAYLTEVSNAFDAMRIVCKDSPSSAEKAALKADFESFGVEATKFIDMFYLASLYDHMVYYGDRPLNPLLVSVPWIINDQLGLKDQGFFKIATLKVTDFPIVGQDGMIENVATAWSYANIASTIA